MANAPPKILLVDDEQKFLNSIAERLKLLGFDPLTASSGQQALALAQKNSIDLAIVDYKMPGMNGLVTIAKLKEIYPDVKTILLTGHGGEKVKQATEALNAAYVEKNRMEDFWDRIKKGSKSGSIIVINPSPADISSQAEGNYQAEVSAPPPDGLASDSRPAEDSPMPLANGEKPVKTVTAERLRMIGETPAIQELRRNIERVAGLDCPLIIRGETGTGKQLTARIIHDLSPRRQNRFMAVNCGSFKNDLLIEELFRPGNRTFTGDVRNKGTGSGSDEGGTLLLDQIIDHLEHLSVTTRQFGRNQILPVHHQRWHALARDGRVKPYMAEELTVASRDGLHWEVHRDMNWGLPDWHPEPPTFGFYNQHLGRHMQTVRPGWGDRRVCLQSTEDFRSFSGPELLLQPDPLDEDLCEHYGMPVFPYEGGYVGLLWMFHCEQAQPPGSFNGVIDDIVKLFGTVAYFRDRHAGPAVIKK